MNNSLFHSLCLSSHLFLVFSPNLAIERKKKSRQVDQFVQSRQVEQGNLHLDTIFQNNINITQVFYLWHSWSYIMTLTTISNYQ